MMMKKEIEERKRRKEIIKQEHQELESFYHTLDGNYGERIQKLFKNFYLFSKNKENLAKEELKEIYEKPSKIRKYHIETVKNFLFEYHSFLKMYEQEMIAWDNEIFEKWGCKNFKKEREKKKKYTPLKKSIETIVSKLKNSTQLNL